MHGRASILGLACLVFLGGCSEVATPVLPDEPPAALGDSYDPATTGTIRGLVTWEGDTPASEEMLIRAIAFNPHLHRNPARFSTPHIPKVNSKNRGVGNAIVFLRGIDPRRSKPWDHAAVLVKFRDRELVVEQGSHRTGVGFVRHGSAIEIVNRDTEYHRLIGRGAGFFAMPLLEANEIHERKLTQVGLVDLTCGAGYYWLHAHLFVVEHPYYVRTDAEGRFTLEHVPAGSYEIVCWLPNWEVKRKERDPETGIIARYIWAEPRMKVQAVQIRAGSVHSYHESLAASP